MSDFRRKSPTLLLIASSLKSITAKPKALLRGSAKDKLKFFGFTLLFIYAFGVIAFMSGGNAYMLCAFGVSDAVLPVMAMVTAMMTLLTSLLRGGKAIFAPNDYDFLMSLPVPKKSIAVANAVSGYVYDLLYIVIFFLPASAVYAYMVRPSAIFYLLLIPTLLILPLIPYVIGSAVGILVAYLASRVKNKNLMTIVINLLIFFSIFSVSTMSGALAEDEEMIVSMMTALSEKVRYVYYPALLCGEGLGGNLISWLLFAVPSILLFALFIAFASKFYSNIHDFMTLTPSVKAKKKKRTVSLTNGKKTTVGKILLKREFKRYFATPSYVVNTIIGPILIIVIAVVFAFVPMTALFEVDAEAPAEDVMSPEDFSDFMFSLVPAILVFPVIMTTTSASSISLEGESRYILKSSPLKKKDIYSAKILHNILLLIPAVIVAWIILAVKGIVSGVGILPIISILILPVAFSVFVSVFGLWCNLKNQKYDWKNEIEIVKQSTAVMIVVLFGMALTICLIALTAFVAALASEILLFGINLFFTVTVLAISYLFWHLSLKNEIK